MHLLTHVVHEKGSPVAVLPLESEGDFAYPFLFKQVGSEARRTIDI